MTIWNPDCKGEPCECPGTEVGTVAEPEREVCPQDPQHYLDSHAPGGAWYGHGHGDQPSPWSPSAPKETMVAESFETVSKALAGAWAWGYAAAQRDALDKPYSDTPEASAWKPTPNPYTEAVDCVMHAPVQHRDRKRPWCNACGRSAEGELIGRPRKEI